MPLRYPRLYNGVRIVDRPCLPNAIRIDQGAMPMIAEMNATGLLINPGHFTRLDAELAEHQLIKQIALDTEIRGMFPWLLKDGTFNVKGDGVGTLLFDELKIHELAGVKLEYTNGGKYSTSADYLAGLTSIHPVVDSVLDIRELRTLRSTFAGPLPTYADYDLRVRSTLKMDIARTARLASADPNLQNIPTRGDWGPKIRAGFIASPGYELASIDLSQIEMVYAADESGDPRMIEVFQLAEDMHVKTACALFKLPYEDIKPKWAAYKKASKEENAGKPLLQFYGKVADCESAAQSCHAEMREFEVKKRLLAKTLGFAVLYGVAAKGLITQIVAAGGPRITEAEAQGYIDEWFAFYRRVHAWMQLQYSRVARFGMVWNRFGRPRLIPEGQSPNPSSQGEARRQAGNTPIQGGSGDHLKIAMAEIYNVLVPFYRWKYGADCIRCCLQIHDELIFEGYAGDLIRQFASDVQLIMQTAVPMMNGVPVKSSAGFAMDWGGLK